jgi:NAD(P)H-dependent flavin oxidoreductase YrpB (nitropropane dioxygenase family)
MFDASLPIIAAPMAGGTSTPAFVVAAARAGGFGLLAGGYLTPDALAAQIEAVRAETATFGVNLFVPNPVPIDEGTFRRYAARIQADAERFGLDVTAAPLVDDDDAWHGKVETLLAVPVPVVGFTFGLPDGDVIAAFRRAGTRTVQTVTSVDEARAAAEAGVDALAVQAPAAGGHSGTWTPARPPAPISAADLVERVRAAVALPLIAAGGIASAADVAAVRAAGAEAAMVGTALLRADESGASVTHRAALADPARTGTVVTRAFTGRPARALRNTFTGRHDAPLGYPAIHHLTAPMRRAAAAAGDPDYLHLWAGTGYRAATAEPLAAILTRLAGSL